MMWFANKRKDSVDVRRLMARILNRSFTSGLLMDVEPEQEARQESRSNVISMPVIVVAVNDDPSSELDIKSGVTQDVSCEGLAILSQGSIPEGEVIVAFGPFDDWSVLKCTCLWTARVGYGYFQAGIHIEKVMVPHDYKPIERYIAVLEQMAMEEVAAAAD